MESQTESFCIIPGENDEGMLCKLRTDKVTNRPLPARARHSKVDYYKRPAFDRQWPPSREMKRMRARIWQMLVVAFICNASLLATAGSNDVFAFGLRHTVLTNAVLEVPGGESPLTVFQTSYCDDGTNCPESGTFGASVFVDASDTGIFISPDAERIDGAYLEGTSYATVDGIANSMVGTVRGTRIGYAEYYMNLDFTPIGATSFTYQVYFKDLLTFTGTNLGPITYVYTGNFDPQPPRVNPLRLKDGRAGVVLEFQGSLAQMEIPGYQIYASRLVITAETPAHVELASRIDIIGSAGLMNFTINDEKLGKFGLHHQPFGNVHFGVTPTQLTLSNVVSAPDTASDGMYTELSRALRCEATLVPHAATNDTFFWAFNTAGFKASSDYPSYFGEVRLAGSNGIASLLGGFYSTGSQVRVFNNGVSVGAFNDSEGVLGQLLGSNLVLTSYFAAGDQTNEMAHIGFRLAESVVFSNAPGAVVAGNEFHVSPTDPSGNLASLTMLTLAGGNLGDVTLTGMQTYTPPVEPLLLEITRSNDLVRISWEYRDYYYLYYKVDLNNTEWIYVSGIVREGDRAYVEWPIDSAPAFFSLRHGYAGFLVTPIITPPVTGTAMR